MLVDRLLTNYEQKVSRLRLSWLKQCDLHYGKKDGLADPLHSSYSRLLIGLLCGVGVVAWLKHIARHAETSLLRYLGHLVLRRLDKSF